MCTFEFLNTLWTNVNVLLLNNSIQHICQRSFYFIGQSGLLLVNGLMILNRQRFLIKYGLHDLSGISMTQSPLKYQAAGLIQAVHYLKVPVLICNCITILFELLLGGSWGGQSFVNGNCGDVLVLCIFFQPLYCLAIKLHNSHQSLYNCYIFSFYFITSCYKWYPNRRFCHVNWIFFWKHSN